MPPARLPTYPEPVNRRTLLAVLGALISFVLIGTLGALVPASATTTPSPTTTPSASPSVSPSASPTSSASGSPSASPTVSPSPEPSKPARPLGATVLIGTGGLTWTDVSETATPNLWTLLRDGSSAAMSIRSVETNTCPVDGWLGISAGGRAAAPRPNNGSTAKLRPCPAIAEPVKGKVTLWPEYLRAAQDKKFGSELGLVGEQAAAGGICAKAVGPGAALGAARKDGTIARYSPWDSSEILVDLNSCPLTLVDVGSLRDPLDVAKGEPAGAIEGDRAVQVKEIDARIGQVIEAAPGGADILVASLSDAGTTERLRLAVARGPNFGPGRLDSPSTKQPGLVQAQDLTVTVLTLAGLTVPDALGGAVLTSTPAQDNSAARAQERLEALVDYDLASHEVHSLVPPFFNGFAYGQLVIYLLVLLVWKGKIGSPTTRLSVLRWVRVLAVAAASVPASTFLANLIPWWRFPMPMLSILGAVGLFVVLIAAMALLGPWGRSPVGPMAAVAAVTMAVLAGDVLTGSRLQLSSLMGLQPVVAGRFYGMGNVTFALFATSALLLSTAAASVLVRAGRAKVAAAVVAAICLLALVIDGAPFWGADGGGPPALLPGAAYLVLAVLGLSMTWKRALALLAAVVTLFFAVALLDWTRSPASRTHLGRFIQSIIDGGAMDIVIRKGQQNLSILMGNAPLTLLVPAALLFVIYVLARPTSWGSRGLQKSFDSVPMLRPGLIAVVITLTLGFALNDSGTAIPAVGATVLVPLIVSVAAWVLQHEVRARATTRAGRRRG